METYQQNIQRKSKNNTPIVILFDIIPKMLHIKSRKSWSIKHAVPQSSFNYNASLFKPTFTLTASTNFPSQNNFPTDFLTPVDFFPQS